MPALSSVYDSRSPAAAENRAALLERLGELDAAVAQACAGGGERYVTRHHERGKLLARERIELLVDRDAPFLELMPVAAYGSDFPIGAGVVTVGCRFPVAVGRCGRSAGSPTCRSGWRPAVWGCRGR